MISVNNLSIHFTGTDLFSNVSFLVNDRDRIGLTGKNGSGKTTLLNIIAGELRPQEGEIIIPTDTSIGYLPQEINTKSDETVYNEALKAFSETLRLEKQIQNLTDEIARRTDYESKEYAKLIHNLTEANDRFNIIGGQTMQADIERVLTGLGFKKTDFQRPVKEFSSGWQMRVELAKILLRKPEVILLDEPTNHLDIESIQWLEEFLINYYGAVMLVSHDRAFLDNVTKRTIEIAGGKIYDYKAGYSEYVKMREERLEQQTASYNNQQKQIREIERFVERFRYKSTKAKQVQSRIKMLDKMEEIELDDIDKSSIHFRFPPAPHSGKVVLEAINLGKKYGDLTVLKEVNFAILKGDKLAFVGRNGEGKSTLAKIIVKELDFTGTLKYGHNIRIGYFAQNQGDYLDPDKTVFETIDDIATGDIRKRVRAILGSFLFSGETIEKKVKVLSGGEKSRLSLAKLLLTPSNLLILDEPTNHLDMQSKDILKNALLQFDGTLIIVSHDRDFLQGLTDKLFEFRDNHIKEHLGGIYEFLETRKLQTLKQLEKQMQSKDYRPESKSQNKLNYEKKRQLERDIRKINSEISKSERKIEELETEIEQSHKILSDPTSYFDNPDYDKITKDYEKLKRNLEAEMNRWEELHLKLEETERRKPN
jgi:ATP-binding cassette subfamily F protein 3